MDIGKLAEQIAYWNTLRNREFLGLIDNEVKKIKNIFE